MKIITIIYFDKSKLISKNPHKKGGEGDNICDERLPSFIKIGC